MSYERELNVAVDAVVQAASLCRAVQARLVSEDTMAKRDRSPVTVADFGAQAVVAREVLGAFPDVPIVGEEDATALRAPDAAALRDQVVSAVAELAPGISDNEVLDLIDRGTYAGGGSGRHWALDPIDGTKGFLRRDQYAVALALIDDGETVLGVLGCPNLPVDGDDPDGARGCLFAARRGAPTEMRTLDGAELREVRVSALTDVTQASFCESVEAAHSSQDEAAQVASRLGIDAPPLRIDSQCKYACVARGDAAVYLRLPTRADYREKIWDHAAGQVVVEQAGGCVTDVRGHPLDFSQGRTLASNSGIVVTNGPLHDEVLAAVRGVLGV